jgi:hypothetical protein
VSVVEARRKSAHELLPVILWLPLKAMGNYIAKAVMQLVNSAVGSKDQKMEKTGQLKA